MDAIECIKGRFSVRRFKPEPVAHELLESVIEAARWSPSYKDSQPWEAVIVSGAAKEALSEKLIAELHASVPPAPDIPHPPSWPAVHQARIDELYRTRNINMTDPEIARKGKEANFRFYGAPHGIYISQDSALGEWSIFDIGLFAQSIMLAAHAKGLGTVPQAFLTDYAGVVKNALGIAPNMRLCLGLSIGYPDMDHPANKMPRTPRAPISEILRWVS